MWNYWQNLLILTFLNYAIFHGWSLERSKSRASETWLKTIGLKGLELYTFILTCPLQKSIHNTMIRTNYGYTTKLFYLLLELVIGAFRWKKFTQIDQPLTNTNTYWHSDNLLTCTITYWLTLTDTLWPLTDCTDAYWH